MTEPWTDHNYGVSPHRDWLKQWRKYGMVIRLGNGKPVLTQDEIAALTLFIHVLTQWFERHPRLLELDEQGRGLFELAQLWQDRLRDPNALSLTTTVLDNNEDAPVNTPVDSQN